MSRCNHTCGYPCAVGRHWRAYDWPHSAERGGDNLYFMRADGRVARTKQEAHEIDKNFPLDVKGSQ